MWLVMGCEKIEDHHSQKTVPFFKIVLTVLNSYPHDVMLMCVLVIKL